MKDERRDPLTEARYGYEVEQNYFIDKVHLSIWNSQGVNLGYELTPFRVEKVSERRWLAQDRAVYLNLQLRVSDSAPSTVFAQIIYDFQKGAVYIRSPLTFGRTWNGNDPVSKNWMSEDEFRSVLSSLDRQAEFGHAG